MKSTRQHFKITDNLSIPDLEMSEQLTAIPDCRIVMFGENDMARRRNQRQGHTTKRGPSWLLEWREDAKNADGNIVRIRKSRAIAPAEGPEAISKREAQRRAWDEVLSGLDKRSTHPSSLMSVEDFVRYKFEPQVVWKKKPAGQKHYAYLLRKLVWTCRNCDHLLKSFPAAAGKEPKKKEYCGCGSPQSLIGYRRLCDVTPDDVEQIAAHLHRKGVRRPDHSPLPKRHFRHFPARQTLAGLLGR